MLNSQNLIDKICAKIACGGLTALETCQTNGALNILSSPVCSVTSFSSLPSATDYAGRMIYVNDENRYYHAVEGQWLSNFSSTVSVIADVAYAWGWNSVGQLGNNCTSNFSSPVSVLGGFTDWRQVSAPAGGNYGNHSAGVRCNGTAWAWGGGSCGRLGNNSVINASSPVSVVGGFTDWCGISVGGCHTIGIRTNGTIWSWGRNYCGVLGNNSTTDQSSPVSVVGGFTNWCQLSTSDRHALAVRSNGSLWAWGYNQFYGPLGDNTKINASSPVSVVGGFTDWCQTSAGPRRSFAVRCDGSLWAWGRGVTGSLGNNCTSDFSSPVSVVGGFTDWCQVSASRGSNHAIALRTNGSLWSWGLNSSGELGTNNLTSSSSPVSVVGGFTDWCQVSAGTNFILAVRTNGTAWAWGSAACGTFGNNTVSNSSSPVSVVGGFTDWVQVSAGFRTGLGIRKDCKGF